MIKPLLDSLPEKLKQSRLEAKLTIVAAARKAEVSPATISKIEKGKMIPTILTLLRIVRAYDKPLNFFIEEKVSQFDYYVSKSNGRRKMSYSTNVKKNRGKIELLSAPFASGIVDSGVITIGLGASSMGSQLAHSGEEVGYCLKGRIEIILKGEKITLEEGDSVHFDASLPHNYTNVGGQEGKIIYFIAHSRK